MPLKKKTKKGKKTSLNPSKRTLEFKSDMEEYGRITKMLGDRKVTLIFPDRSEMLGLIPGRFRKRCWMAVGDVVIVSHRTYETKRVDIIHKYDHDEIGKLVRLGEIPSDFFDEKAAEEDSGEVVFFNEDEDEVKVDLIDFNEI
jgi:translation initiation factor 1A